MESISFYVLLFLLHVMFLQFHLFLFATSSYRCLQWAGSVLGTGEVALRKKDKDKTPHDADTKKINK